MHGAKGLEYDLVILPGLNRRMSANKSGLLNWYSFTDEIGNEKVVMAPVRNVEEKENSDGNSLNNPELNFSYNYMGFKKISGWWILIIILIMISIPISLIYLFYLVIKSILSFIF